MVVLPAFAGRVPDKLHRSQSGPGQCPGTEGLAGQSPGTEEGVDGRDSFLGDFGQANHR
jgi:hypothetical protein